MEPPAVTGHPCWRGALAGVVATAFALGVAELVAAAGRSLRSPVLDVGARVVDGAPRWLKDVAISTFGTNDKVALIVGIATLLVGYAALIGALSTRRRWIGPLGVAVFVLIGVAASSGSGNGWLAVLPSIAGGAAGAAALWALSGWAVGQPTSAAGASADPATRRTFLRAAGAFGVAAVVLGGAGRWLSRRFDVAADRAALRLPRAATPLDEPPAGVAFADVEGLTPFVTSNADFYRIDTALVVPQVPLETWRLSIDGMVDSPMELTFDELAAREVIEADVTLTCVSNEVGGNLAGNARWLGVRLDDLLREAGVQEGADQVVGHSVDRFTAGFPTAVAMDGRDAIVAIGMNGEPLPVEHGFPARLVVPGVYGYVSATKWLSRIELTRFDAFDAYWVRRGWSDRAPIKTFSRIDTPGPLQKVPVGRRPVAGVAWAQTVGIDRVEVRVDGGPWMPTTLSEELNDVTWRQWMLPVELASGRHEVECRATDRTGAIQPEARTEPFPDGATGWHSVVVLVD